MERLEPEGADADGNVDAAPASAPEPRWQPVPPSDTETSDRDRLFQSQARALGDATRHRIFRYVVDADAPVGVAAITAHVGLNHNSVRQHLAKLCNAELLVEELSRSGGRGRPAFRYRPAPAAIASWATSSAYEQLSMLLLEVLSGGGAPRDVGAAAGRRAVAGAEPGHDPLDVLEAAMTRRGFRSRRDEAGAVIELVLSGCPFGAAATTNAAVVCELHRGLAEGMVEALGTGLGDVELVVEDPLAGGCRVRLERDDPT